MTPVFHYWARMAAVSLFLWGVFILLLRWVSR